MKQKTTDLLYESYMFVNYPLNNPDDEPYNFEHLARIGMIVTNTIKSTSISGNIDMSKADFVKTVKLWDMSDKILKIIVNPKTNILTFPRVITATGAKGVVMGVSLNDIINAHANNQEVHIYSLYNDAFRGLII